MTNFYLGHPNSMCPKYVYHFSKWPKIPHLCECLSLLNWTGTLTLPLLLKLKSWFNWSLGVFSEVSFFLDCFFSLKIYSKSILLKYIMPRMEFCCHVWAGAPNCCLDIFFIWVLSKQLSYISFMFFSSFYCNSIPCSSCSALHRVNPNYKKICEFLNITTLH